MSSANSTCPSLSARSNLVLLSMVTCLEAPEIHLKFIVIIVMFENVITLFNHLYVAIISVWDQPRGPKVMYVCKVYVKLR